MSQLGNHPQVWVKIKNLWNHLDLDDAFGHVWMTLRPLDFSNGRLPPEVFLGCPKGGHWPSQPCQVCHGEVIPTTRWAGAGRWGRCWLKKKTGASERNGLKWLNPGFFLWNWLANLRFVSSFWRIKHIFQKKMLVVSIWFLTWFQWDVCDATVPFVASTNHWNYHHHKYMCSCSLGSFSPNTRRWKESKVFFWEVSHANHLHVQTTTIPRRESLNKHGNLKHPTSKKVSSK